MSFSRYNDFQECIIEDIVFEHFATTVKITFNNIWNQSGEIREDLDSKELITLEFNIVRSFILVNDFNKSMIDDMEKLNWGYNEISLIKKVSNNKVEILWENDRKIVIEFDNLSIHKMQ